MAQLGGGRRPQRTRAARVQITYDIEVDGEQRRKELPFVFGVLGDFAGQPEKPLPRLRDRDFVDVSLANVNTVLRNLQPRLALRVDNKLSGDDSKLAVTLQFGSIDDFEPEHVARQVEPLRALIAVRQHLSDLRRAVHKHPQLAEQLREAARAGAPRATPGPDGGAETAQIGSRANGDDR